MKEINNLLGSLYKGDTKAASASFEKALEAKKQEVLAVKKVALTSEIFKDA